ncbi:alpha-tocopherol transfer protein-like [Trichonephila clavata]|uniref:Alpha-tocopherol transfer protein-like n=1 Tax=Trichonephila clavata TaxID=2740835 RepID=A0A8X6H683_TRICU|nr:alpha-tocopherol transfer protein-like [Trichonephila clavata]
MTAKYEEMMKAKGFLPYVLHTLPEKFIQKAEDQLGETDEIRKSALEQLKKRILEDKKLKCPTDDEFLIQFLRARKYDVDNALGQLNNYFNLITSHPELYECLDKDKMDKLTSCNFFNILPFRDNDGCLVLTCRIENWNPDDINVQIVLCTLTALLYCLELYPANQITGVRIIFDAKNYSFKQLRCFVPRYVPLIAKALRNCLPVRFKSIHIVNEAFVFRYAWSVLKLVLTEKIKSRMFFHGGNIKEIHEHIPKEVLPQEYGGEYTTYNDGDIVTKEQNKFFDKFSMMIKTFLS